MAKKQDIKISEARIMVFLKNAEPRFRFAKMIGLKLGIDYGYLLRILSIMVMKDWISMERRETKVFYTITTKAPTELAIILLAENDTPNKQKKEMIE